MVGFSDMTGGAVDLGFSSTGIDLACPPRVFATDRCAMKIGPCPQCPESDGWRSRCQPSRWARNRHQAASSFLGLAQGSSMDESAKGAMLLMEYLPADRQESIPDTTRSPLPGGRL